MLIQKHSQILTIKMKITTDTVAQLKTQSCLGRHVKMVLQAQIFKILLCKNEKLLDSEILSGCFF